MSRDPTETRTIWLYRYLRIPAVEYVRSDRAWSKWIGKGYHSTIRATGNEYQVKPVDFNCYHTLRNKSPSSSSDDESGASAPSIPPRRTIPESSWLGQVYNYYDINSISEKTIIIISLSRHKPSKSFPISHDIIKETKDQLIPPNHLIWSRTKDLAFQYYYDYELKGETPQPSQIDAVYGYVSFYLGIQINLNVTTASMPRPIQKWYLIRYSCYEDIYHYHCYLIDLYLGDEAYIVKNQFPLLDYDPKRHSSPTERFIQYVKEYKQQKETLRQKHYQNQLIQFATKEKKLKRKIIEEGTDLEAKRYFYTTHPSHMYPIHLR